MATLKVNSPPTFTRTPENVRINAGKTVVFQCEAKGQPQPGIFWSKEGDEVNLWSFVILRFKTKLFFI